MSLQFVVALSVAISVTCLLLGLFYSWRDAGKASADDRLSAVVNREFGSVAAAQTAQPNQQAGFLNLVAPRLSEGLKPKTGIEQEKLKLRLAQAGFNGGHATDLFLGLKMICLMGGGFFG